MAKLPRISSSVSPDLRQYGDRVREAFKDVEDRANALEEALDKLLRDQSSINSGMASMSGAISEIYNENWETPHAPLNVVVTGAFSTNIVEWDKPTYNGHAYSEIWAATEPDGGGTPVLGDAILVGQTPGTVFAHDLGGYGRRWYWVKFVNKADVPGPFNAVDGLLGETSQDPAYLISILSETYGTGSEAPFFQLDAPELINGVTVPAGTYIKQGWIADASINTAKIGLAAVDSARIADLAVTSAKISEIDAGKITSGFIDTDRLNANSITAGKIDSRGLTIRDDAGNIILGSGSNLQLSYIDGLGSLATLNSVDYANVGGVKPPADADRTAANTAAGIAGQGAFATLSKIVNSNKLTYIDSGVILDAYIQNLGASRIDTAEIAADSAFLNNLEVDTAQIATAAITNAKIANAAISNAKIGNAAVDTLQIAGNAVTVPAVVVGPGNVGSGVTSWKNAAIAGITLNQSGSVLVLWNFQQGYSSEVQWSVRVLRNGTSILSRTAMAFGNDYPSGSLLQNLTGGVNYSFTLQWAGQNSNINAVGTLILLGAQR